MKQQVIISVGREYGSAGHEIARQIAARLELPFYDQNHILPEDVDFGSDSDAMEQAQFDSIRQHAEAGESFVIVGRCSEYVLRQYPGLITIFVLGDVKQRQKRIMTLYQMDAAEARAAMDHYDKKRQNYHNEHSDTLWGEAKGYDICVNSSRLGVEGTVRVLEDYIRLRMQEMFGE